MSGCPYSKAWTGTCNAEAGPSGFCADHTGVTCTCGEQASHECSHTGQFVCGRPLCASCEGFTDASKPSGSWGFMNHTHRRKLVCEEPAA